MLQSILDPRLRGPASGLAGAPGVFAAQARTVCTPGPGPVTTPTPCLKASVRERRSTKVTRPVILGPEIVLNNYMCILSEVGKTFRVSQ